MSGKVVRKRNFSIINSHLVDVVETYRRSTQRGEVQIQDSSERAMVEQLSRSRGRELSEVLATIQPGQYQQIAAGTQDVMLIQGVAGSGKSIVGLHRIAYLLSPFNRRQEGIEASQVAFLGPTRAFLQYVTDLLPSLNVRDVELVTQDTVSGWLVSTLKARIVLDRKESLLEKLLKDRSAARTQAHQAARLKGSLLMARTLDRYVDKLRKQYLRSATSIAVQIDSVVPIILDSRQVKSAARAPVATKLNDHRELTVPCQTF